MEKLSRRGVQRSRWGSCHFRMVGGHRWEWRRAISGACEDVNCAEIWKRIPGRGNSQYKGSENSRGIQGTARKPLWLELHNRGVGMRLESQLGLNDVTTAKTWATVATLEWELLCGRVVGSGIASVIKVIFWLLALALTKGTWAEVGRPVRSLVIISGDASISCGSSEKNLDSAGVLNLE